jgi:hypothetical protein
MIVKQFDFGLAQKMLEIAENLGTRTWPKCFFFEVNPEL